VVFVSFTVVGLLISTLLESVTFETAVLFTSTLVVSDSVFLFGTSVSVTTY
jgi:hypothetical protein